MDKNIFAAIRIGDLDAIKMFISAGGDPNTVDAEGETLLNTAVSEDAFVAAQLLLLNGAIPSIKGNQGFTGWHWIAYDKNSLSIAHLLHPWIESIDWPDDDGMTPLAHAMASGNLEIAKHLLKNGADPNSSDEDGWTLLHDAASRGNIESAELLLEFGASIEKRDKKNAMPCQYVSDDFPELLLKLIPV